MHIILLGRFVKPALDYGTYSAEKNINDYQNDKKNN